MTLARIALAALLAAIAAPLSADETALSSPRLQLLRGRASTGAQAVADFWRERAAAGAPMVEPIAGDAGHVLATFLWRGEAATKSVHVIAIDQIQFDAAGYLSRGRMDRLAGTDVWYRTYRMPCDLLFSYRFSVDDPGTITRETVPEAIAARDARLRPDPLNPVHYASRSGDSSVAQLPCADPQPDMERHEGVAHGEVTTETFAGASGESHELQIYLPPRPPGAAGPLPLVVTIGGQFADNYPMPTILDNLIATKKIPPAIVVTIGFANMTEYVGASRSNERFAAYVARELVPWLRGRYAIDADPRRLVISGASAPGAGSIFVATRYPEVFGNAITLGGGYAYPRVPAADELIPSDRSEAEPIARELASRPALPVRVYLSVGTLDDVPWEGRDPRYGFSTVLVAARHLRDVLEARGYCLVYKEFGGGHEALVWRRAFAAGLTTLLGSGTPCAGGGT